MTHHSSRQTLLTDKNGRSCDPQELADHIRALRRYAYALVGRSANADDFVQETLRRAISHLREGKEIHNLRSYLLTILHNVRNDHIKHERRYGEMLVVDEDLRLAVKPPQLTHIECQEVADVIQSLPEDQRAVLLLVGLEGMTYQDAMEILNIPIGTVMSRLNRGRNAIKSRLGMDDVTISRLQPIDRKTTSPVTIGQTAEGKGEISPRQQRGDRDHASVAARPRQKLKTARAKTKRQA